MLHASEETPIAAEAPVEKSAEKPSVEKIDENRYRVGKIEFDPKTREIRIPAKVNMAQGLLEFLIVHENGKIHESLFTTDASPSDINLAITLLRYKASRELYALPNETGGLSGNFPDVPEDIRAAARVRIDVEWDNDGKTERVAANEWIQHATTLEAMPSSHWVYGGSQFDNGRFSAETTGDIAAIFLSNSAMINYPGRDNGDDTVWLAFENRVPSEGTNLTLIIAPYPKP
ncbi:MAG: YdjY domain-containing protein [Luteolibacter sp.]